jgi:cytochrome P450
MTSSDYLAPHALLGQLPEFVKDPLAFLSQCAASNSRAVPLRLLHVPALVVLDPTEIERVLVTEHAEFVKPLWLRTAAVRRLLGDGLVTTDGDIWRRKRRACSAAFHQRRMALYGCAIGDVAQRALGTWKHGETRSLQREMSHLTLEIVARTLLDADVPGWTAPISDAMDVLMARFASKSSLFGMTPWPPGLSELRAARKLNLFVDRLIANSPAPAPGSQVDPTTSSLLTMLRATAELGGEGVTGPALRDQIKTFLGAGYESSALTATWAFLKLAEHPSVEAALVSELRSVVPDGLPSPGDVSRLPCTQAVVKETLRLYPPLWMTGREATRRCVIGDIEVRPGTLIMTSQWAVQRKPIHFREPDAFRPERWLNGETSDLPRFAYFPFGGGPRICIGQSFAMLESVLLLAAIASKFRLLPIDGQEVKPWATMTLRPSREVQVRLVARELK